MRTEVIVSNEENEKMMDLVEEADALKVLAKTIADNNEIYHDNSDLYVRIKNDMKNNMHNYQEEWGKIIVKYQLDIEKSENYVLNFNDRSIHYVEK